MYAQFGSNETGWKDKLMLQVNNKGVFHPFFLDQFDLDLRSEVLVAEIIRLLADPPSNWQISAVAGSAGPDPLRGVARRARPS
jgi:hypothetical protein